MHGFYWVGGWIGCGMRWMGAGLAIYGGFGPAAGSLIRWWYWCVLWFFLAGTMGINYLTFHIDDSSGTLCNYPIIIDLGILLFVFIKIRRYSSTARAKSEMQDGCVVVGRWTYYFEYNLLTTPLH